MTVAVLIVATMLAANPSKAFLSCFEQGDYYPPSGHLQGVRIRYRLFVPRDMGVSERCPMLVWLHSYGEGGDDNVRNVKWLEHVINDLAHVEKRRFFLLAVQCPKKFRSWVAYRPQKAASDTEPDDMLNVNFQIIQKLLEERPIDKNRICLTGWLNGGSACWDMAARHPKFFSTVVPMVAYPHDLSIAPKLVNVPIWSFHNQYHPAVPLDQERKMVEAVKAAGGTARMSISPEKKYSCFIFAFGQHKVLDWMLAQKRGAWVCWTPPGFRPWRFWHVFAVPCGYAAIVGLGFYCRGRRLENKAEK